MYCTDWLVLVVYGSSPCLEGLEEHLGNICQHMQTVCSFPSPLSDCLVGISPHHTAQHLCSRVKVCILNQVTYRLSGLSLAYVRQVFPCMGAFEVHGIPPKLLVLLSNPGRQTSLIPLAQEFWPLANGFSEQETQLGDL